MSHGGIISFITVCHNFQDRAFYEGEPYKVDPDVLVREDSDAFKLKVS